MDKQKALKLPDAKPRDRAPVFSFGAPIGAPYVPELRDVTKPIAHDGQGRPLYAPRGFVFRLP